MARKAQIRYWQRGTWQDAEGATRTGGFWTTIRGQQFPLALGPDDRPDGPTFREALRRYREKLEMDNAPKAQSENTVAVVFELYLAWMKQSNRKPGTYKLRKTMLTGFVNYRPEPGAKNYGQLRVRELAYTHAEAYCSAMRERRWNEKMRQWTSWGGGHVRICLKSLHAALNWAAKPGRKLIPENPLRGMECPAPRNRSAECLIPPELHRRVVAICAKPMREFVIALENTGARPGEIAAATAADWNDELGALVYLPDDKRLCREFSHKTAARGKERWVFFTGEALDMVRRLARERPSGCLFRPGERKNTIGKWRPRSITNYFIYLRKRVGAGAEHLTAYGYRHTWITRALNEGMAPVHVAALTGNSPEVIFRHYSHVDANRKHLKDLAEQLHLRSAAAQNPVRAVLRLLEGYLASADLAQVDEALALLQKVRADNPGGETPPAAVLPFAARVAAAGP